MAEEYNEDMQIINVDYVEYDEHGQLTEKAHEDDTIINSMEHVEDYVYLDEEQSEEEVHDEAALLGNNEALHYEPIDEDEEQFVEIEDGRMESAFEVLQDVGATMKSETLELQQHMPQLRHIKGATDYYYCQECQVDYDTIEEFASSHALEDDDDGGVTDYQMQEDGVVCSEQPFDVLDNEAYSIKNEVVEEMADTQAYMQDDNEQVAEEIVYNVSFLEQQHEEEINEEQLDQVMVKQETIFENSQEASTEKFICYECQLVFSDLQAAESHECSSAQDTRETLPDQTTTDIFECSYCQTKLKTFGGLQRHRLNCRLKPPSQQSPPTVFQCDKCKKLFPNAKTLLTHGRTHLLAENKGFAEPIVCNICNTTFTCVKNLKLHLKIHDKKPIKSIQQALPAGAEVEYNELNQFFCEICNKSFDQNLLAVHKNMHQNVEEFNCSVCNKQFENMPSYEMHMQLHVDKVPERRGQTKAERWGARLPFPCNYCGREFLRPHEKVKHERIHTGEKPYECEVCGKTFRVSYSLTLHLRTHTDIRPYVCATCNKRFKSQPVYAHHLNTHLAERPYKCPHCPKSFRTSVQLCGHKNSHTKPFNCTECNRPFATLYAVKIHMKTHSKTNKANENLKHRCAVCGAVYARIFALRYHMKEQHALELANSGGNNQDFELSSHADEELKTETADEVEEDEEAAELDDEDAAVLIAAAAGASVNLAESRRAQQNRRGNAYALDDEISEQAILQSEEIVVDNFHTEEIVTDWLIK